MKNGKSLLFSLSSAISLISCEAAEFILREFPDGETYIQIKSDVKNRDIIILADLNNPNAKILPVLFLAKTLREQGAKQIILIAPYLPYMRQDKMFHPGEAFTAKYFAELISPYIDKLITVDPHLHRIHDLSEIYDCETIVLHATDVIAQYIQKNIKNVLIVGPDGESEQWAREIAEKIKAPMVIAHKIRHGDYEVEVEIKGLEKYKDHTAVLVDDIISTAQTMIQTINYLKQHNFAKPICIGVHAVFAGKAYENLQASGSGKIITCNTITHSSNQIDISELIARSLD